MLETIILACLAVGPALVAFFGIVFCCAKLIHKFNDLRKEVLNAKDFSELKAQLKIVYQENIELKKTNKQLLSKLNHIKTKED